MPDNDDDLLKRQQEQQEQQQQEQQPQQRTPLPDKPEQGDTSALSPLHKGSEGIDMSKRPKTKAPSGARRMGMQMTAEARQFRDEFRKSLQEDKENISNLFASPERQAGRQAGREERKAAKRQTETTADTTEGTSQGRTADPRVAATEQANKASLDAMDRYIDWTNGLLEERRKRDEEQERRDRQNAVWRGIGEAGAALVNLLGVSGAFGGKNAYGRGAYSAMQNFTLTTEKMTDKIRAQREKNRERMDALQDRLGEIMIKRGQIEAQGIAALGEVKGKAKDAAEKIAREDARWQAEIELRQQQIDNAKEQADRQYQLSLKAYEDNRKALDDAAKNKSGSGGSGGSGGGKGATPVHLRYPALIMEYERDENGEVVKDENGKPKGKKVWGWKYISAPGETFYKTLHPMRGQLADELARMLGYTSFNDFNGNVTWDRKDKKYIANDNTDETNLNPKLCKEVKDALMQYRKAVEGTRGKELSKGADDELNDWADRYWSLSDKFGALLDTALASYNPYGVSLQSSEDAPQGYGEENDEDFPDYDGMLEGVRIIQ